MTDQKTNSSDLPVTESEGEANPVVGNGEGDLEAKPNTATVPKAPGQTVDLMTIIVDKGGYRVTLSSTRDSVSTVVEAVAPEGVTRLGNYMWERSEAPRTDILLAGVDAFSRELFSRALKSRGVVANASEQS